jgi:hypothetical protein
LYLLEQLSRARPVGLREDHAKDIGWPVAEITSSRLSAYRFDPGVSNGAGSSVNDARRLHARRRFL